MTSSTTDRRNGLLASQAIKTPVKAASAAAIAALTGLLVVDGYQTVSGDRVLVKNQVDQKTNGIYNVASGAWSRAKDADGNLDWVQGTLVFVINGTVNAGLFYEQTTAGTIVVGTSNLAFSVCNPGTPITLPLSLANGGTGGASAVSSLSNLGVVQVTAEAGTANAQTGTIDALVTAFRADQLFEHIPSVTNTGALQITYTPNGGAALAAKNVFQNGAALVGGEFVLGVPSLLHYDGVQLNIIGSGFSNITEDINPDKTADYVWTYDASAKLYKKVLLQNASPMPRMAISGLVQANGDGAGGGDLVNDITISVGSARDSTDVANMFLTAAITKQLDAAWAVGSAAGGLDTGAIGNSDYYLWLIKRVDTGVVDALFSLSSTAPTMPANYTLKRLIGWIKRVGATIVAFHAYEREGGGLEMNWDTPTLDINLANTLTTARRTDAVKTPLNFSTIANLNVFLADAAAGTIQYIYCPDASDMAPSVVPAAPLATIIRSGTVGSMAGNFQIRTSSTGTIAARSDTATVDTYAVSTLGFAWARRS